MAAPSIKAEHKLGGRYISLVKSPWAYLYPAYSYIVFQVFLSFRLLTILMFISDCVQVSTQVRVYMEAALGELSSITPSGFSFAPYYKTFCRW